VWDSVSQCNACEHSSVLIAAQPVAHLISERAEGPGHLRRWFLPREEIQKLIPESGVGPKLPVNQRDQEFGTADLSIRERTLPLIGPSGSNAGPDETSSRLELGDRFATTQLPFVVPKVSPRVSPKVSPVI
jgi:hypothetical protein